MLWQIALAAVGSSGLFTFIQFLINRKDKSISDKLATLELDICRVQLLIMINHYPRNSTEILKIAEHYFNDLDGDWYMTSIFNQWLVEYDVGRPEWFDF